MKKWKILLTCSLTTGLLTTGCTSFSSDVSAVKVDKNGGVQAVVVETLDKDYYDESELTAAVEADVSTYEESHDADAVKIKKLDFKDGTVTLNMKYADSTDYQEFNNVVFYAGDLQGAYDAGYDFPTSFQQVEKGNVTGTVTSSDILSGLNYSVVVYSEEMGIQVPGSILYTSPNVTVTGKNKATNAADSGTETTAESETEETGESEDETSDGTTLAPSDEEVLTGEETVADAGSQSTYTFIIYN